MNRMLVSACVMCALAIGCDSGGGDDTPPPAGPPAKGARQLGIDASYAETETFMDGYNKASETGMDFLTLPLNWNAIERGPDDDFSFVPSGDTYVDAKKWNRVAASGTFEATSGALHWEEASVAADEPRAYTRYEMTSAAFEVSLDVTLNTHSAGAYNMALILSFTQDGDDGNSKGASDTYVGIVSLDAAGTHYLAATYFDQGTDLTPAMVAVPQDSFTIKVQRSATNVVFLYDDNGDDAFTTLYTLDTAPLSAAFDNPARAYIYCGNPDTGSIDIDFDNWQVLSGDATYDTLDDRYITGEWFDILGVVDLVYGQQLPIKVGLSIRTINTVTVELPSDLARITSGGTVDFSDTRIAARYGEFLNHVASRIPNVDVLSVSVGNEVDVYLGGDAAAWSSYKTFVDAAVPLAHAAFGAGVPVGAKATHGGVEDATTAARIVDLNANTDVIMITYYPLNGDFTVRDPSEILSDFTLMDTTFAAYPSKEIFLLEAGLPSSPTCNSSEAIQAEFVTKLFAAWDTYATRVTVININWLTDVTAATLAEWEQYYGLSDPAFLAYLGTLGLRNADTTEKTSFGRLIDETTARGWIPRDPL